MPNPFDPLQASDAATTEQNYDAKSKFAAVNDDMSSSDDLDTCSEVCSQFFMPKIAATGTDRTIECNNATRVNEGLCPRLLSTSF